MNRGTLMVLKRLLVTALSAFGLGALTAGTAFAQDPTPGTQIPAPKLYGAISNCGGGTLPTSPTAMGSMSILELALARDRTAAEGVLDLATATTDGRLIALLDPGDTTTCDNPVANGYDGAIQRYNEYVRTKGLLPAAGADPDPEATANYNAARMDREAYGGAVFNEVYNQQMQLKSVRDAVMAYNGLVGATGDLATLTTAYDAITISDLHDTTLSGDELTADQNRVYGSMGVRGYQAINGNNTADDTTLDGTELTDAFNDAGVLRFANTGNNALVGSTNILNLGDIEDELEKWKTAATSAQETLDNAIKVGHENLPPLREDLRRKQAARDHVQSELNRLTAIARGQNRDLGTPINIGPTDNQRAISDERSVLNEHVRVQTQVKNAADGVRSAVRALENSNKALQNSLKSPDDYLSQLVGLRTYEQTQAQEDVDENGGANAAPSLKQRLTDANTALTAAQAQQSAHTALTGGQDTAASKLLGSLLEPRLDSEGDPNPADDDGLALVNAISQVGTEVGNLKSQLTDDEGNPIDLTNLGDTEAVMKNTNDIAALTADTDAGDESDGPVTANTKAIVGIEEDLYGTTSGQHADAPACAEGAGGLVNIANCADARSRHNADDIEDVNDKLMLKKEYIDNLAEEIGVNPMTGEGTGEGGMSRIDMNAKAIADEADARMKGDEDTLKAANMAAMEGDAKTLEAANMAAMEGDAKTLEAANMAAMEGDAKTLEAANMAAMEGDAKTLTAGQHGGHGRRRGCS